MTRSTHFTNLVLLLLAIPVPSAAGTPPAAVSPAEVAMFRGDPGRSGVYDTAAVHRFKKLEWAFATGGPVRSSPAVTADTVYVGSGDGMLYAIDRRSGEARWRFAAQGPVNGSPAVAGGVVYAGGGDGMIYALDATTGARRWQFATGGRAHSSPAVAGGVVYAGSMDADGHLYAIDRRSGELVWKFKGSDLGKAVVWLKSFGGAPGTGFVKVTGSQELPVALEALKAVAEFRGD